MFMIQIKRNKEVHYSIEIPILILCYYLIKTFTKYLYFVRFYQKSLIHFFPNVANLVIFVKMEFRSWNI